MSFFTKSASRGKRLQNLTRNDLKKIKLKEFNIYHVYTDK